MKAFVVVALLATSVPIAAAAAAQEGVALTRQERRVCTRVELRGASRVSYQRVCRTPTEWRERLGPDWRQALAGQSAPDEGMDTVDMANRDSLAVPGNTLERNFGRPGGGTTGPQ